MRPLILLLAVACSTTPSTDGADPIVCGPELTCTGDRICLQERFPPTCTDRQDTDVACPEGTTESMCGGDGHPCCCGPTPANTYQCLDASTCGAVPTCDCVGEACPSEKQCSSLVSETSGMFTCEDWPVP